MTEPFRRARSQEHKEDRREAILAAAASLMDEHGLEGATLALIADRVGVSKAALYRYFPTREAIFLALLLAEEEAWLTALERALAPLVDSRRPDLVAAAVVSALCERPRLPELVSVMAGVLERNVDEDTVVHFKLTAAALGLRLANALKACLPSISGALLPPLLRSLYALVAGFWPMLHPPAVVERALARPELAASGDLCVTRVDLELALTALLVGYSSRSTRAQSA